MAGSRGFVPIRQPWRIFRRSTDLSTLPDVATAQHEVAGARAAVPPTAESPRITAAGVIRALPYPVMVIGLDDSVREWNEAAATLYEIPAENAVGRQFRDLDIGYRAEGLRARIEDAKRGVASVRLDNVVFTRRSGEPVHVDFWVSRVYDERSRSTTVLVAAVDGTQVERFREEIVRLGERYATATEELQSTNEKLETTNEELQSTNDELETTNEELRSANEQLVTTVDELQAANRELAARSTELRRLSAYHAAVVSGVREAIVVLDHTFSVTVWNPAAERLFGLASPAAVGRDFFSLPLGTPEPLARLAFARLSGGGVHGEEVQLDRPLPQGGTRPIVVRFETLVDSAGAFQGLLGLARPD